MYRSRRRKILSWLAIFTFGIVVVIFLRNSKKGGLVNSSFPKGFLNVAIWEDMCGDEMLSLKEFPLFPHGPSTWLRTSSLRMHFTRQFQNFGLRMFGYLSPRKSGNYNFHLASSASSELWISSDSKPENSRLIANVTSGLSWLREENITLSKGNQYYLEVLHKHGLHYLFRSNYLHLKWRLSHWKEHDVRDIPSDALIAFEDDHGSIRSDKMITNLLHSEQVDHNNDVIPPMHIRLKDPTFPNEESKRRVELYHLPFISEEDTRDLFPPCQYSPSYIVKKTLWRYQGTWETHYTSIYPFDYSDLKRKEYPGDKFLSFGNDKLDEKQAQAIASQVWMQIQSKHPGKYFLQHTLNVEDNHDQGTGDRYLVELELVEISSGKSVRFSEYVYRPWGTSDLCSPVGIAWNKSAVINIILTTGNKQGRWLLHFLYHMSKIHKRTKDFNFNVVITEYDGVDVDIRAALKRSGIPHYQHVRLPGKFQKALGLQLAAGMVKDPNSILFVMDLHLDIPYHFFDDVRKHCIQHRVAYNPLLTRLSCGNTAHRPFGWWETHGYGLMAMYKSDWDRIGGMNVEEFKNKWGGEDWEICDRILMDGMEIERVKMIHLFHYFHSKRGMWADAGDAAEQADHSDNFWV